MIAAQVLLPHWKHLAANDKEQEGCHMGAGGSMEMPVCTLLWKQLVPPHGLLSQDPHQGSVTPGNTQRNTHKGTPLGTQPLNKAPKHGGAGGAPPPSPIPQPLTSLSQVAGLFSRVTHEESQEHVNVFQTRTPEPFGHYTGPSLLSLFSLLKSIYPSPIVISRCHRIPHVR